MTTDFHTAVATGAAANASIINSPLAELDAAIGARATPAFSVTKGTSQGSIATATDTLVTWPTEAFDTDGDFSSHRFTPSVAGKYLLIASLYANAAVDNATWQPIIYKNGSRHRRNIARCAGSGGQSAQVAAIVEANGTTDYFEIYIYHEFGSDATIGAFSEINYFAGFRISE